MKDFKEILTQLNACNEAQIWADNKTIEEVIKECKRGDWMLWLAKKLDVDIKLLTLTKGYCAKTVEHLMKDERSKKAVQAAIDFGEGKITKEELAATAAAAYAAYAAYAAAYAAYAAAYADADAAADAYDAAAYAAAYAAYAAYDAAAYAAAYAAYAAADAAAYAAYAAAATYADADAAADAAAAAAAAEKTKNRLLAADICRKYIGQILIDKVNRMLKD